MEDGTTNSRDIAAAIPSSGGYDKSSSPSGVASLDIGGDGAMATLNLKLRPESSTTKRIKKFQTVVGNTIQAAGATWEAKDLQEIPLVDIMAGILELLPRRRLTRVTRPISMLELLQPSMERIVSKKIDDDDEKKKTTKWTHKVVVDLKFSSDLNEALAWVFTGTKCLQIGSPIKLNIGRITNKPAEKEVQELLKKKLSSLESDENANLPGELSDVEIVSRGQKGKAVGKLRLATSGYNFSWVEEKQLEDEVRRLFELDLKMFHLQGDVPVAGVITAEMVAALENDEAEAAYEGFTTPKHLSRYRQVVVPDKSGLISAKCLTGANSVPLGQTEGYVSKLMSSNFEDLGKMFSAKQPHRVRLERQNYRATNLMEKIHAVGRESEEESESSFRNRVKQITQGLLAKADDVSRQMDAFFLFAQFLRRQVDEVSQSANFDSDVNNVSTGFMLTFGPQASSVHDGEIRKLLNQLMNEPAVENVNKQYPPTETETEREDILSSASSQSELQTA